MRARLERFGEHLRCGRILVALTAAWLLVAPAAYAQCVEREPLLPIWTVLNTISNAQLGASPQAVLDAFSAYLDDFELLIRKEDADLAHVREQSRTGVGTLLNVRDATRVQEIQRRARKDHEALLQKFIAQLREGASAESASRLESVHQLLRLSLIRLRLDRRSQLGDIAEHLPIGSGMPGSSHWEEEDTASARELLFKATVANIEGRTKAFAEVRAGRDANAAEWARHAERLNAVGMTPDDIDALLKTPIAAPYGSEEHSRQVERNAALYELAQDIRYPSVPEPARRAVLLEELKALEMIEPTLTPHQRESVVSGCLSAWGLRAPVWVQQGASGGMMPPRAVVQFFLRAPGLTPEQQSAVRTLGRAFIQAADKARHGMQQRMLQNQNLGDEWQQAAGQLAAAVVEIAKAAGASVEPPARGRPIALPTLDLSDSLSREDSVEFGWVQPKDAVQRSSRISRAICRPVPYSDALVADVYAALSVPESRQPLVKQVIEDARERWTRRVQALCDASELDPEIWARSQRAQDAQQAQHIRQADVARASEARTRAFREAFECDDALFDSLRAALGAAADDRTLQALATARRVAHAPQRWDTPPTTFRVDIPDLVLHAPVSAQTRRKLVDEFAPLAESWKTLAAAMVEAQCARRNWDLTADRYLAGEHPDSALGKAWAKDEGAVHAATAEWDRAAAESEQRLAALVPESERAEWDLWLGRVKYSAVYADTAPLNDTKDMLQRWTTLDAATLSKMDAIAAEARAAAHRAGDAAVLIVRSMGSLPASKDDPSYSSSVQEPNERIGTMRGIGIMRVQLAAIRMCLLVPPGIAARAPYGQLAARLALSATGSAAPPPR